MISWFILENIDPIIFRPKICNPNSRVWLEKFSNPYIIFVILSFNINTNEMPNTPNNTSATNHPHQQVPPQTVAITTVTSIDSLRTQLHKSYKQITQREPLDLSYQFYLLNNGSVKPPQLPQKEDDMYSSFNGNVRDSVESYQSRYGTRMASQVGRVK